MEKINVEKVFIISIDKTANQSQRKKHFQKLVENMKFIFQSSPEILGVDGNKLSESQVIKLIRLNKLRYKNSVTNNTKKVNFNLRVKSSLNNNDIHPINKYVDLGINVYYKRDMRIGEVGCFLSHMTILERIVRENITSALILEDDAVILCKKEEFGMKINEMIRQIPDDFYVLSLFQHKAQKNDLDFTNRLQKYSDDLYKIHTHSFGAVGYIISLKAARYILKCLYPMKNPFDYELFKEIQKIDKGYLLKEPMIDVCLYDATMTRI